MCRARELGISDTELTPPGVYKQYHHPMLHKGQKQRPERSQSPRRHDSLVSASYHEENTRCVGHRRDAYS